MPRLPLIDPPNIVTFGIIRHLATACPPKIVPVPQACNYSHRSALGSGERVRMRAKERDSKIGGRNWGAGHGLVQGVMCTTCGFV